MVVLALLMAGTSWAVASWVSAWLVPPYLILMALLLAPSTGRSSGEPASGGLEAWDDPQPARSAGDFDDLHPSPDGPESPEATEDGSEPGAEPKAPRARRGKGRVKKAKATPGPTEATWVQVAPGKFIRVEPSDESTGQAGPHSPVGIPVEVPTAPQPLEFEGEGTLDGAEGRDVDEEPSGESSEIPAGGSIEGPDPLEGPSEDAGPGDPSGAFESGPSTDQGGDEIAGSPRTFEGTSAADGNAPQAEEPSESPGARRPDVPLEAVEGHLWAEPASPQRLADVPPEPLDERGASLEGTDPTETPVDETDLDDAGPSDDEPLVMEAPRGAEPSETETDPVPPDGPSRRPGRLASRAWTRVGSPPRAADREAPPRRPVRSRGPSRRPRDPRRLGRQGAARPRQVNRTFPPRSPPSDRRRWVAGSR